jgi:hypothetical protein
MSYHAIRKQILLDRAMAETYRYASKGVNMEKNCKSHPHEDAAHYQELEQLEQYYDKKAQALEEAADTNEATLRTVCTTDPWWMQEILNVQEEAGA